MKARIAITKRYEGVSEVARLVGVNRSTISRLLHGQRSASPELAKKLESVGIKISDYKKK